MPISLPVGGRGLSSDQAPSPLLLTGKQAAQLVSLCEKSLYLAARRGELRVVRIGRAVRYRLEDP